MLHCGLTVLSEDGLTRVQERVLEEYAFMPEESPGRFYTYFRWPEAPEELTALAERVIEMIHGSTALSPRFGSGASSPRRSMETRRAAPDF